MNLGDEVICIKIREANHPLFTEINSKYREVEHIGRISSAYPLEDLLEVTHAEYFEESGETREFVTLFFTDELERFNPPRFTPLIQIIKRVKNEYRG